MDKEGALLLGKRAFFYFSRLKLKEIALNPTGIQGGFLQSRCA